MYPYISNINFYQFFAAINSTTIIIIAVAAAAIIAILAAVILGLKGKKKKEKTDSVSGSGSEPSVCKTEADISSHAESFEEPDFIAEVAAVNDTVTHKNLPPKPEKVKPIVDETPLSEEEQAQLTVLKRIFVNRLYQSDLELKKNYSAIKNELLSYVGVKSRLTAPCDTFKADKDQLAKVNIDGRKLIIYLKLDPEMPEYNDGTCPHRDMGHKIMYSEVPFRFTITSGLALRRCIKLISDMMANLGLEKNENFKKTDYVALYPQMSDLELLKQDANAALGFSVKKIKEEKIEESENISLEKEVAATVMAIEEAPVPELPRKIVGKEGNIDILKRVFVNRLHQADEDLKENYSMLKNELLSYRGVKCRFSAPCETFRANKEEICKINIDGRKLIVYMKLDPNNPEYNDGTCPHRDMGHKYMYSSVPFRFTITSGLALRRCLKLISDMMTNFNYIKNPRYKNVDFAALYPYMDDAMLLSKFNGQ